MHLKGGRNERVFVSDIYQRARRWGEQLARAAHVNLHDDSERGETQIRTPDQLDETVRDRLGKEFAGRGSPRAPAAMTATLRPGIDRLVIEIPRFKISSLGALQSVFWVILFVFAAWAAIALYFHQYIFAVFGATGCGAILFMVLRSETVVVTRDSLTRHAGIFFFQIPRSIPLAELEELTLINATKEEIKESEQLLESGKISRDVYAGIKALSALGSAIAARSDRHSFTFGRILSDAELDYILYEIEQRIRH